jgi:hypothetical protein
VRATRAAGLLLLAALGLGGCTGVTSPDLFAVARDGRIPGARLRLTVSDGGTARCNGGPAKLLPDPLLLDAREIARQIKPDAQHHVQLPGDRSTILSFVATTPDGRLAFADTASGARPELAKLALLTRQIAQRVCGLPR